MGTVFTIIVTVNTRRMTQYTAGVLMGLNGRYGGTYSRPAVVNSKLRLTEPDPTWTESGCAI